MAPIEEDELGEVENLSLFEKYPEAFKRLSILIGVIVAIVLVISLITGQAPAANCVDAPVPVLHEEVCHGDMFCIREMRSSQCVEFWAEKNPGGADLGLLFTPYPRNMIGHVETDFVLLEDGRPRRLVQFEIPEGEDNWALNMAIMPQLWTAPAEPDATPYVFPLDPSRGYKVAQAPDRPKDHTGMLEYAIDIEATAGTPVRAMKDGFVVGMRMDSRAGGPRPNVRGKANYIWIQHLDGTIATYRHLLRDSAKVEFGEPVVAGQEIAQSGATGFVDGPMLHVHVSSPLLDGSGFQTFPMVFQTTEGNVELETFEIYRPSF